MLVKDALTKIVYKATIMTYQQSGMGIYGLCIQEGYSSDLKGSLFADCEVEYIAYDNLRKRTALTITREDLRDVVAVTSIKELKDFLQYQHGFSSHEGLTDEDVRAIAYSLIEKY